MNEILHTPNKSLVLRLFDLDLAADREEIYAMDQDPVVMKYLTKGVITTREAFSKIWLPRIRSYTVPDKGYGMWRVALAENDECIGELVARPMHFFSETPHYHNIELGWRFIRSAWGKGYATEAAQTIMRHLSQHPEVTQFSAIADNANLASIKVMQKLGMHFVKHYIHSDPLGETEVDCYSISKNE